MAERTGDRVSAVVAALGSALVTRWAALPALTALELQGKAPRVNRGRPVGGLGDSPAWVLVEFDGRPDAETNASWTREWLDMACTRQRELGQLMCTVAAQTGDDDVDTMEAHAHLLLDACTQDLKSDLTVGGILWSQNVQAGSAQQLKNSKGVAVIVPFAVAYAAAV